MAGSVDYQWPQSGTYRSNVVSHKLLGGEASSLSFSGLTLPAGYTRLEESSITLIAVSGAVPWSPPDHPFPNGWDRRFQRSGSSFSVTFAVPSRTAVKIYLRQTSVSGLRVRARCHS